MGPKSGKVRRGLCRYSGPVFLEKKPRSTMQKIPFEHWLRVSGSNMTLSEYYLKIKRPKLYKSLFIRLFNIPVDMYGPRGWAKHNANGGRKPPITSIITIVDKPTVFCSCLTPSGRENFSLMYGSTLQIQHLKVSSNNTKLLRRAIQGQHVDSVINVTLNFGFSPQSYFSTYSYKYIW